MSWVAVGVAGATLVGSIYSSNQQKGAAQSAANAQQNAADQAIQQTEQNYQRTAGNLNPYISAGNNALGQMQALNSGDYSSFKASPDYQFSLSQGIQGLDRSAAARGSLYSGGHSADILGYAQGLASQNYGNYYNRLAGLAGVGQTAANQLGAYGQNYANAVGNLNMQNAGNQMNSIYNRANASSNFANQLAGIGGNLAGRFYQPGGSAPTYNTNNTFGMNTGDYSQFTNPNVSSFYGNGGGFG